MDTQDLTANSNISSVALKYIQNQEKTLQIQPNNSNTLERVPSEDSFVSSNKKTIVTGIVATLLTLTGFAYMAKKGLFGEKLQNFIENIFKKQTPPTNIDTKNLEKNSSSKIIPDTDNKIKPQQPSSQVDDKIIPQQPLVQGNDKITQQPSSQVDEAPVAPKNNLQSPSLEDLKTGTTILDKKKIAYDLCKDEFTAEWVSKLNDEEFEKAKKLMEKGCFENAHIAAKLQGEDYEKALELADLGYKGCHLDEIAVLQGEDFSHAKELIQKGVKYNIDTIAKLRGTNYEQALVLADKKVDNYELFKIASLDSNSFKKVMALSQNDEASKVIRKDATEQEHRFAKTILYGEDFKKIHYNYQEDFLELSYDEVLKAKDYLKRGLEYYTIPSLTHLDEKQAARADIVLNMPQFKEGRQVVYLAQLEDEQFQKALDIINSVDRFKASGNAVSKLVKLNEAQYKQAEQLFSKTELEDYHIPEIAELDEPYFLRALDLLDRKVEPKSVNHFGALRSELNIVTMAKLPEEEYERIFQRGLLDKFDSGSVAGLAKLDDKTWNTLQGTSYFDTLKKSLSKNYGYTFTIDEAQELQNTVKSILELKKFSNIENINELSIRRKRLLMKKLISLNENLYNKDSDAGNLISELAPDVKIIPNTKEEYNSLLQKLIKSVGIDVKSIDEKTRQGFYDALSSFDKPQSALRTVNFNDPNFKIELKYPREEFISSVDKLINNLDIKQQNIVCDYFGFEFRNLKGKKVINGYPVNINNGAKLAEIKDEKLKEIIEQMRPLVQKFAHENEIVIKDNPELEYELNQIIKAFPEFLTEIGKKQHKTHDYTLDIHSLKVLQGVINNPEYEKLPENDKTALKISALMHDITKREGIRDSIHPQESAFDIYYILEKLQMPEDEKLKIYQTIKTHNWLQQYNGAKYIDGKTIPYTPSEKTQIAKDLAFELKKGNAYKMADILTQADLKAVKRDTSFFSSFEDALKEGEKEVGGFVEQLKKDAICLPQTKIPTVENMKTDGIHVKDITTKAQDGSSIQNRVLFLTDDLDLSQYGFEKGTKSEDLNVLVHALNLDTQSTIFQALGQIDSDALLSSSYVNYAQKNYHVFRKQGFVLDVDCDDINAGYFRDFGSGCKKDLDLLKNDYLYNGGNSKYRNYIANHLKKALNLSDEQYKELYGEIENKSIVELKTSHPKVAEAMQSLFKEMEGGKRNAGRQYNEILISRPKIQAVFAQGKKGEIEKIPEFLRKYAQENNLPIIYFGE